MKCVITLSLISVFLCLGTHAAPTGAKPPKVPLNFPALRLRIEDFSATFKQFWEQWKKIQGLGIREPDANNRLRRFLDQINDSADRLMGDQFKRASNEIINNPKADPTKKMEWTTKLFNAYTTASDEAKKYIAAQTTEINKLFDALNPQSAIKDLDTAVQQITTSQTDAASKLIDYPDKISTELNLDYSLLEQAAIDIRNEMKKIA